MKKISAYIKCPRCDLNYIPRGESMCDVCKAELNLILNGALLSDEEEILCPICKQNYMSLDDEMCLKCLERNVEIDRKPTTAVEWDEFNEEKVVDDVPADDLEMVSLSALEDEEKEKFFDDEDEEKEVFDEEIEEEFVDLDDEDFDEDEDEDEDDDF